MNLVPDKDLYDIGKQYMDKYDRNVRLLFSKKDLVGSVANWSVKMSPYEIPPGIDDVLDEFNDNLTDYFDNTDDGYMEMNVTELIDFLKWNLITIDGFKKWNLSKYELDMGVDPDDNDRDKYRVISKNTDDDDPYYDFVDLDALYRNVAYDIYEQNEKITKSFPL